MREFKKRIGDWRKRRQSFATYIRPRSYQFSLLNADGMFKYSMYIGVQCMEGSHNWKILLQ